MLNSTPGVRIIPRVGSPLAASGFERPGLKATSMKDDDKKMPPRPAGWRPDIIVVPVNQPLPPPPGIEWWLRLLLSKR
jgi:hypothetical protein